MVHVLRIVALFALVAVSATAETVELERHQSDAAVASHARLLTAEAGSSSGTGGAAIGSAPAAMGGLSPAKQAIVAQWTAAKGLLERAFAGEPTLLASLNQFQEKVTAALQKDDLTLDDAKTLMSTWLASLETDPAFAKVAAQLAPMKAALGGASATKTGSGSGMGSAKNSTVGTTSAPVASAANNTARTPAPTNSASTVATFVVPVVVVIAGVFAAL